MTPHFTYGPGSRVTLTFPASDIDFRACNAARHWLELRGFSVGTMQGAEPRGIMFRKDMPIGKWRTLVPLERDVLHGRMTGDMRRGPIEITIFETAPAKAREAIVTMPPARPTDRSTRILGVATDVLAVFLLVFCVGALGFVGLNPIWKAMRHHDGRKFEMRAEPFGVRTVARETAAEGRR